MMQTSTHSRVMRPPFIHSPHAKNKGFSLVEILVSLAVLAILLLINVQVIDQVQSTWAASNARVSQFREARTAFDILVPILILPRTHFWSNLFGTYSLSISLRLLPKFGGFWSSGF